MDYTENNTVYTNDKKTSLDLKIAFIVFMILIFIGLSVSFITNIMNISFHSQYENLESAHNQTVRKLNETDNELVVIKEDIKNLETKLDYNIELIIEQFPRLAKKFEATAYTADYESTGKTQDHPAYGITYSGNKVKEWHTIAADPEVLPIGTEVFIPEFADKPNNGIFVVEDTGLRNGDKTRSGSYKHIEGKRIDIYHPDLDWAKEFGRKQITIIRLDELAKLLGVSNNDV